MDTKVTGLKSYGSVLLVNLIFQGQPGCPKSHQTLSNAGGPKAITTSCLTRGRIQTTFHQTTRSQRTLTSTSQPNLQEPNLLPLSLHQETKESPEYADGVKENTTELTEDYRWPFRICKNKYKRARSHRRTIWLCLRAKSQS